MKKKTNEEWERPNRSTKKVQNYEKKTTNTNNETNVITYVINFFKQLSVKAKEYALSIYYILKFLHHYEASATVSTFTNAALLVLDLKSWIYSPLILILAADSVKKGYKWAAEFVIENVTRTGFGRDGEKHVELCLDAGQSFYSLALFSVDMYFRENVT